MPEPNAAVQSAPEPEAATETATKPFGAFLHEHRAAGLHNELGEGLAEIVAAVLEHQKTGTLEIKIKVAPSDIGGAVVVTDEVKVKAPQADPDPSLFFSDRTGNLSRRDPRQAELPLRDASKS